MRDFHAGCFTSGSISSYSNLEFELVGFIKLVNLSVIRLCQAGAGGVFGYRRSRSAL